MSEHAAQLSVTERIVFSGRVQGVGFRATTRRFAKPLPVTGYVRNLPDGTVELVLQGTETAINDVLARITAIFRDNLANVERTRVESGETFSHFEIRH